MGARAKVLTFRFAIASVVMSLPFSNLKAFVRLALVAILAVLLGPGAPQGLPAIAEATTSLAATSAPAQALASNRLDTGWRLKTSDSRRADRAQGQDRDGPAPPDAAGPARRVAASGPAPSALIRGGSGAMAGAIARRYRPRAPPTVA
ncbi:MAG: hypothetical protein ACLGIN_08990 [Candidatus Sericytochromatia bacterium]